MTISQIQWTNYYQMNQNNLTEVKKAQAEFLNGVLEGKTEQEALLDTLNALDKNSINDNYSEKDNCTNNSDMKALRIPRIDPEKIKVGLDIISKIFSIAISANNLYDSFSNEEETNKILIA